MLVFSCRECVVLLHVVHLTVDVRQKTEQLDMFCRPKALGAQAEDVRAVLCGWTWKVRETTGVSAMGRLKSIQLSKYLDHPTNVEVSGDPGVTMGQ